MHSVQLLNQLVENHQVLAYLVIFIGLILEGEVVVITAGVLIHLGALDFTTAFLFIIGGSFAKTFSFYYLGLFIYEKYSHSSFMKYIEKRVAYFMPRFKQKPFWSIFVSKFISGINYMILILAGFSRINIRTCLKAEVISTFVWAPLLLSLGYFFSQTAITLSKEVGKFSLVIFFFVVAFIFLDKLVAGFWRIIVYMKNGFNINIEENINENKYESNNEVRYENKCENKNEIRYENNYESKNENKNDENKNKKNNENKNENRYEKKS